MDHTDSEPAVPVPSFYLSQREAVEFDKWLMDSEGGGFSLQQLMELAGLSVAQAVLAFFPQATRILVVAGPGNNGGDGLVAARHLAAANKTVQLCYPVQGKNPFYQNLLRQCANENIPVDHELARLEEFDLVIDALFGFGFAGHVRPPFDRIIETFAATSTPIASVDVPSGWDVEAAPGSPLWAPRLLISLTAPKACARHLPPFTVHVIGGRFIPRGAKSLLQVTINTTAVVRLKDGRVSRPGIATYKHATMIVYFDIISNDELISDSFPMEEVDGVVYEVTCRQAKKAALKIDIGANPATGDGEAGAEEEEPVVDDVDESPINDVVDAFKLCETGFSKKDYMTYLKSYLKSIRAKLEETNPSRVAEFEAGSQVYAKKVLSNFDSFRFYQGENMDPESMVCLLGTRPSGEEYMIYWKDGMRAVKY